jgi:Flp pilus assembly protein TadG
MSRIHSHITNLLRDERGNTLMTFGLTSLVAIAAAGGAVDLGRTYSMKSKMQNALDAAVVSGISKYRETADWTAAKSTASATFQAVFTNAVSLRQTFKSIANGLTAEANGGTARIVN